MQGGVFVGTEFERIVPLAGRSISESWEGLICHTVGVSTDSVWQRHAITLMRYRGVA